MFLNKIKWIIMINVDRCIIKCNGCNGMKWLLKICERFWVIIWSVKIILIIFKGVMFFVVLFC